jgi:hypothetical protein
MKELEDKPSSSSIQDLLKWKSPEELAEICKMAAIQCQSASASGKHSPASSKGSTNAKEAAKFPYDPVSMPPNWYQDSLFQDSQDPYDGYNVEDLNID